MTIPPGTRWTSVTTYVDQETGQLLTKYQATHNNKYIVVKTLKKTTFNHNKTHATNEYVKLCRKQPQINLFN